MTKNQKKMLERILVTGVLFVALLVLEHIGILEQITIASPDFYYLSCAVSSDWL